MVDPRKLNAKALAGNIDKAWKEFLAKNKNPKNEEEKAALFKEFISNFNPELSAMFAAIEINAMLSQINLLVIEKKLDEALKNLDSMLKLKLEKRIENMVKSLKASCLIKKGDIKKAEKIAIELMEHDAVLSNFHMAQITAMKGDMDAALKFIDLCIEKKPTFEHFYLKSNILKAKKDPKWEEWLEKAKTLEEKAIKEIEEGAKAHGLKIKKKKGFLEVSE